jgi:hypothetical protein
MTIETENEIAAIINNAQDIVDPLDALIVEAENDPQAPLSPATVILLAGLRKNSRTEYESLLTKMQAVGVDIALLDAMIDEEVGALPRKKRSQIDELIELGTTVELFHAADNVGFAHINDGAVHDTLPLDNLAFHQWLARKYYRATGAAASEDALRDAINQLNGKALYDGPEREVHMRVASVGGKIYLDLADKNRHVVVISADGWNVTVGADVRFQRPRGTAELPMPTEGGSLDEFRSLVNLRSEDDLVLTFAWLLAGLRGIGPFPVLALVGEQGSAKSTLSKMIRSLVDPNEAPLRPIPRSEQDLFLAARNGHVQAYDNLSELPPSMSDALCRLATGGSFATRRLYSNDEEFLVTAVRPIMLNGIGNVITQADLADRAVVLHLAPIPDDKRLTERELRKNFEERKSRILGLLLTALANGLKRLPEIVIAEKARMADFEQWGAACETVLWPAGTFQAAYRRNRQEAAEEMLYGDPVANAIRTFVASLAGTVGTVGTVAPVWSGTPASLLDALDSHVGEAYRRSKDWPKGPRMLSGRLDRAVPVLRKTGITIERYRGPSPNRHRLIDIFVKTKQGEVITSISPPLSPSAPSSTPSISSVPSKDGQDHNSIIPARGHDADSLGAAQPTEVLPSSIGFSVSDKDYGTGSIQTSSQAADGTLLE